MQYPFIHLRSQSSYSLSEGALKIEKLVNLAKKNNMPAIALTDNNNMFGILEFSIACINNSIQPIIGTSINYLDIQTKEHPSQLNFLVMNEEGYINLLYLSSISHTSGNNPIGIYHKDLKKYTNGLICYIGGEYNPLLILKHQNQIETISAFIEKFQNMFDQDFLFEIQRVQDPEIDEKLNLTINKAQKRTVNYALSNTFGFGGHNASVLFKKHQ